jgi:hypothetical protein
MIKKPAKKAIKKAKSTSLSRTVKSTQKSTVKKAKLTPLSRTVNSTSTVNSTKKRTQKSTTKKAKLTPLAQLIAKWDKDQGPLPSLYDTATQLDDVVNTLTNIQHLMDSALDDCVDLTNNDRALSLLYLAYEMVKVVIDKTDPLISDLYRINRANLK